MKILFPYFRILSLSLFFGIILSASVQAQSKKTLVNIDDQGIALQQYDTVAFFTQHKPVKGTAAISTSYDGAIYYFATDADKKLFVESPAKYAPQFGGFCAYAVSRGRTASITPSAFQIINDQLILQYDEDIRDEFNQDAVKNLAMAKNNWPKIVAEKGK